MAQGTLNIPVFTLQKIDYTGTTDANSNLSLAIPGGATLVLFLWDNYHVFIPFRYNNAWYARVQMTDFEGSGWANKEVNCSIYYIK